MGMIRVVTVLTLVKGLLFRPSVVTIQLTLNPFRLFQMVSARELVPKA